jgi:hypothetical protein
LFRNLPERQRIQVVCIDLNIAYRAAVKSTLRKLAVNPHVKFFIDKFPITELVDEAAHLARIAFKKHLPPVEGPNTPRSSLAIRPGRTIFG